MLGNAGFRPRQADDTDIIRAIPGFEFDREPPRREWMVEGAFPLGSCCMLSGDGGVGKSLICQQLCTAAALGLDWLGLRTTHCNTLHFMCEDDQDEALRREAAIFRHYDRSYADTEGGLHLMPRVGRDNVLAELDRKTWRMIPTKLREQIGQYCRQHAIRLVVIDTATMCFNGNQNDERHVVDFVNSLRRLAIAIQGCVILTKHPSLSGRANGSGESGSTSWNNAVRSRLYLRDTPDGTVLQGMKSNYGRKLDKIRLRYEAGVFMRDEQPTKNWYEAAE